jgi:16S rRNA (cytosine1402-N4)-methyltransferase
MQAFAVDTVKAMEHRPVLLDAVLEALAIRTDGVYVDGTFGRGGHSLAVLDRLGPGGRLFAFDKDPQACAEAWKNLGREPRFRIQRGSYTVMHDTLRAENLLGKVQGLLLDLGVSSPQLDDAARGFSFMREGPLDMRMDPTTGESAASWLARAEREEISQVLKTYGDERHHWRIAGAIVRARDNSAITTTTQLAAVISDAMPGPRQRIHPATRSFQALRIFLNRELEELGEVLRQSLEVLAPGGRLAVISFHSLEDRMVKRFMRDASRPESSPLPMVAPPKPLLRLVSKPIYANETEIAANPRARSAVLRVAERTDEAG